jgi:hypothetical protein
MQKVLTSPRKKVVNLEPKSIRNIQQGSHSEFSLPLLRTDSAIEAVVKAARDDPASLPMLSDRPLDENNDSKFNKLVKKYTKQFIVPKLKIPRSI